MDKVELLAKTHWWTARNHLLNKAIIKVIIWAKLTSQWGNELHFIVWTNRCQLGKILDGSLYQLESMSSSWY